MRTDLVVLLGAGGHAKVVYDAIGAARIDVRDDNASLEGKAFLDTVIRTPIGTPAGAVHIAIGDNRARAKLMARLGATRLLAVIHPAAAVSPHAAIAAGAFVAAGAVVAASARVGECAIINHRAVVDHDCIVGACAHVAPAATLGGAVEVGEGALIGSGAVVLPGIRIGKWAVVGAGAVVNRPVADGETVYGVPARGRGDA
jgi:sugar O-acyltransferase (sialic acid O-acetyltransferase NeuD family)